MPIDDLHKRKRKKNIAVLLAIIAFMVIVFFVTMIRIKAGMSHE
jgi:predicted nucleic acid-binding Zn ribbon protein